MPTAEYTFSTAGSWATTNLTHMGQLMDARAIYLEINSNMYLESRGGGAQEGFEIREARIVVPKPGMQDQIEELASIDQDQAFNLCFDQDIFPGEISFVTPNTTLKIVFTCPHRDTQNLQVFLDDIECTESVCEIHANIDSIKDVVELWITLVTERTRFGFDQETTVLL